MATWKRLTEHDGSKVDINMYNISHMELGPTDQITSLFIGTTNVITILVRETPT